MQNDNKPMTDREELEIIINNLLDIYAPEGKNIILPEYINLKTEEE